MGQHAGMASLVSLSHTLFRRARLPSRLPFIRRSGCSQYDRRAVCLRWSVFVLLLASTLTLILAAGCNRRMWTGQTSDLGFMGDAACVECHPKESKAHQLTSHAHTFRPVNAANMGADLPKPGPIADTGLCIYDSGSGLSMGWKDDPSHAAPMQYALGSNRFGFTYLQIVNNQSIVELRRSYAPRFNTWLPTPGQGTIDERALGKNRDEGRARHCIGCHVVALPPSGVTPDPKFFGVGCEACHGPGQKHADARRSHDKDTFMPKLATLSGTQMNELCGRCHRTAKDIPPGAEDMTQRFEPYGLMKSKCFLESGGDISCVTCHDPHQNASTDKKHYEAVCLKCHGPAQGFGPVNSNRKPCPVNPKDGCIGCHMPQRKLAEDGPITMSEHFIRIMPSERRGAP